MIDEYRLVVIGMGYVGLTLAAVNAKVGFSVFGIDTNKRVVSQLKEGKPHFHENGLVDLMESVKGSLKFFSDIPPSEDLKKSIFIIAVGTSLAADGNADYSQLDSSIEDIAKVVKSGDIVILRSTVIAGTTAQRVIPRLEELTGLVVGVDIFVGFAPERTIEGRAIEELRTLPQVIAASDEEGLRLISGFFKHVSTEVVSVDTFESAEMVKLISNAYRDLTFAFANSVALSASRYNVDVQELITAANKNYKRNRIPSPSPGVGGYCLTKDPYLYAQSCGEYEDIKKLMHAGRTINAVMPRHVANIADSFSKLFKIENPLIVIVGLAFKSSPPTSDVRFSPSIELIKELQSAGMRNILAYDPHVPLYVYQDNNIEKIEKLDDALVQGDVVIFMHGEQNYVDEIVLSTIKNRAEKKLLIDTWGVFPESIKRNGEGIEYANLSYRTF